MSDGARRFLVVNQHADNRGDEAAMRAMIRSIDSRFPGSTFVVVAQARDQPARMDGMAEDVVLHSMFLPPGPAIRLIAYAFGAAFGVPLPRLLSPHAAAIVAAYREADVVITAPGGPYFGDIYVDHELVHWFFVYLARVHGKPVFQYAPSCGPFRIRPMNWLRRRFYRWIDVLVVREEISGGYLRELLGPSVPIHVSVDAAVQDLVAPASRDTYFQGSRAHLRDRFIVAVTLQRYAFAGDAHPQRKQAHYEQAVLACLEHLANRLSCHFLLFPQLCGAHSDVPVHRDIGGRLAAGVSWELVDPDLNSDGQRALFGMADFCIASRYHPQIFATSQGVPGLFICYEHKQRGYLQQLGLDRHVCDIRGLDAAAMVQALDDALDHRAELSRQLQQRLVPLREIARQPTQLLEQLLVDHRGHAFTAGAATRGLAT